MYMILILQTRRGEGMYHFKHTALLSFKKLIGKVSKISEFLIAVHITIHGAILFHVFVQNVIILPFLPNVLMDF